MEQSTSENLGIGLVGRMIRTFSAPSETFASVRERQTWLDWFVPVLIVALVSLVVGFMTMPIIMQAGSEMVQEQLRNMPEEQRAMIEQAMIEQAMMEKMQGATQTTGLVMIPIMSFVWLFVAGAVLLVVGNFILGGEATYGQMLAVNAYASLVSLVKLVVTTPLMLAQKTAVIHTGLGLFLSEEMGNTFLGRALAGVEVFMLWQVLVTAIGMGVMAGCSTKKALIPLLIIWAIWIVVQAVLGGLGAMFGQGG